MTQEDEVGALEAKIADAERRLESIMELASGQVMLHGTAEENLADAELRLNHILALATDEEPPGD